MDFSGKLIFLSLFFSFNKRAIVSRVTDGIGSVDCNQAAEQLYLQPVLGWLINRRHKLLSCLCRNLSGLFVCLLVFIDLILRVDSREPA